jgi:nitrite reductase (NADH) small subunit
MTRVCSVSDVPLGEGRAVLLDGQLIAVFHTRSGWFALDQRCPHKDGPLADGIVAEGCVICPLHERRFDLASGRCLNDPALEVGAYSVELRDEGVYIASVHSDVLAA